MNIFDTTFDYTPVVEGLTADKARFEEGLSQYNSELSALQGATPYVSEPIVAAKITAVQQNITSSQATINNINAVLAEIATVGALPTEAKEALYYFYTVVEVQKVDFMAKMLFNHSSALANPTIIALQADLTTPSASKVAVAKLIYQSYSMTPQYIQQIISVYRYVR